MKLKKIISKILVLTMLLSTILYIPSNAFAEKESPNLTVTNKVLWINGYVNININNKISGSKYTWAISDSSIANIDNRGVVTGLKAGNVTITCTIITNEKTYKLESHITVSNSKIIVENQEQLDEALNNSDIKKIIIKADKEAEFTIKERDFSDKRLYLKAPNATIINNGKFKSVHTYVSNQEQLEKALNDSNISIITLTGTKNEDYIIDGDYPNIRLIIDNPKATLTINGSLRDVDVVNVKDIISSEKKDSADEIPSSTPSPTSAPVNVTPSPTSAPVNVTPSPTPVDLDSLKVNYVSQLEEKANVNRTMLPDSEKASFDELTAQMIDQINNALTENEVIQIYNIATIILDNFNGTDENDQSAESNADYQAYLDGNITLHDLYVKYAKTSDGYTYTIPNDGVFYFAESSEFVYIDYQNNKTYTFIYEEAYWYTVGSTVDDFRVELIDKINTNNYLDIVSNQFDGCIVSFNSSSKTLAVINLVNMSVNYHEVNTESTSWTGSDGKLYYGSPLDLSTLDYIGTIDGEYEVTSVSGSAISFDLYMNNQTGINRVELKDNNEVLPTNYYNVIYNNDNTAVITFNIDFFNDFLAYKETNTLIDIYLYPTEPNINGTRITFKIQY
jgi:hypothetical protein